MFLKAKTMSQSWITGLYLPMTCKCQYPSHSLQCRYPSICPQVQYLIGAPHGMQSSTMLLFQYLPRVLHHQTIH
jgi:hypothetical protein